MMNLRKMYALLMVVAGLGMSTAQGMFVLPLLGLSYNGYKFGSLCYQQKNNSDIRAQFAPIKAGLNTSFASGNNPKKSNVYAWKKSLDELQKSYPHLLEKDEQYKSFRPTFNVFSSVHTAKAENAGDAQTKTEATTAANTKANAFIKQKEDNAYSRWWSLAYRSALCCAFAGLTIFAVKESRR
jgi:hypothetical protein